MRMPEAVKLLTWRSCSLGACDLHVVGHILDPAGPGDRTEHRLALEPRVHLAEHRTRGIDLLQRAGRAGARAYGRARRSIET